MELIECCANEKKAETHAASGRWSKTGIEYFNGSSSGGWSSEIFCYSAHTNPFFDVWGDCTSYNGNFDGMGVEVILKNSANQVIATRRFTYGEGENWTGTYPFNFRLNQDELSKFGGYGSTVNVYVKLSINRGSSGCGNRTNIYTESADAVGHAFGELSGNRNRKELIAEKFFDYENCTTNCDNVIEAKNVMSAAIYYTIMCNQQGSHKGNGGACSYMDLYLTVTNSQTGQVVRDGAVYQSGCCHGDRKLYINNQHLMNISYGFPVDIKLRIKAITCTYKAHIWGGRSWIAVLRYVGAKLLVDSYATNNIETDVDFAISRKNEYFSPSNTYKKLTVIEDALGHEFDIELNAKLAYSLFKKALNSNKYKCTDIAGNFEDISVVEKDRDVIEKCYDLDKLKIDYNPFKFQLDTKKINNINKPVFEKIFCYKNIKLSITVLSRISKSNNSDVEMTLELMIENDKKGESITNASETFYVDLIGNYKIIKKVEV